MKKPFLIGCSLVFTLCIKAQYGPVPPPDTAQASIYRGAAPRINDLVHTKLEVRFDYSKSWMYGKAWITLKPHFYATDSLSLDAKGMDISKVTLVKGGGNTPLKYTYDGMMLNINLGRTF